MLLEPSSLHNSCQDIKCFIAVLKILANPWVSTQSLFVSCQEPFAMSCPQSFQNIFSQNKNKFDLIIVRGVESWIFVSCFCINISFLSDYISKKKKKKNSKITWTSKILKLHLKLVRLKYKKQLFASLCNCAYLWQVL